jgi:hypothetical protein
MDLIADFIWTYRNILEFLLYFLFFGSMCQAALHRHLGHHGGKVAVAMGLIIAAGLVLGKDSIGFALRHLGLSAVLLLLLAILVVAYRFMRWLDIPNAVALAAAAALALAGANSAMPKLGLSRQHWYGPLLSGLLVASAALALSAATDIPSGRNRRPLVRAGQIPGQKPIRKELKVVRQANPGKTKQRAKRAARDIRTAAKELNSEALTPKLATRIRRRMAHAETEAARILQDLVRLQQLAGAAERLDRQRIHRAAGIRLPELAPEQRRMLKESLTEERRRLGLEEGLQQISYGVEQSVERLRHCLEKATRQMEARNAAGALGWLAKADETIEEARALQGRINQLHRGLTKSLKHQLRAFC